ncbi:MAG: 50S ribosomal protein L25/general stress protein Ctc [Alphaproteobacteria bacterium]|nr:50S ribosomal protein L25/general stress protein Ctc [Alphaproteobacteria bacterium]
MKAAVELNAEPRPVAGKGAARAARRAGQVPVVVYGNGKGNVSLNVEARAIANEYFRGGFMNKIVALKSGGKDIFAIPREVQLNPVSDKIEHADFLAVDDKSVVKVWVPVHFVGTEKSVGLKRGGVLNVVAHRVELLAPVASIPAAIEVDVSALEIGSSVHIGNLVLPKGVVPASKRTNLTIASIAGRQKEEEADVAAAPVAGAVPASTAKAPAAGAAPAAAAKPAGKK